MSAIKCSGDRRAQGHALCVIDKHGRPRNRLKRDPVQANRATKRNDCEDAGTTAKHGCKVTAQQIRCQRIESRAKILAEDLGSGA